MSAKVCGSTRADDEGRGSDDRALTGGTVQDADAGSERAWSKAGHDLGGIFSGLPRPLSDSPGADESNLDATA